MARYVLRVINPIDLDFFDECFSSYDEAQNYAFEKLGAKLINGQLCNTNGDRKSLVEIFKSHLYYLEPLSIYTDQYGIFEDEIINVHIEEGHLVITKRIGSQTIIET